MQAVELGDPVNRPVFGGAPGSEPFNSFGGIQDVDGSQQRFTALWSVTFEDDAGPAKAYFGFLLSFSGEVIRREGPLVVREDDVADHNEANAQAIAWIRDWTGVQ